MRRSVDFYRRLGAVFPRPLPNSSGRLFHASCEPGDGHSSKLTPVWNTGWAGRTDLQGRVDQRFKSLTGAGYREL
jgi:hypothetical protein